MQVVDFIFSNPAIDRSLKVQTQKIIDLVC